MTAVFGLMDIRYNLIEVQANI